MDQVRDPRYSWDAIERPYGSGRFYRSSRESGPANGFERPIRELYAALGDDPFLVQECLARPALVDRLTRNFYDFDGRFHAAARGEAESLHRDLLRHGIGAFTDDPRLRDLEIEQIDLAEGVAERAYEQEREFGRKVEVGREEYARWRSRAPQRPGEIGPLREEREAFVVSVLVEERAGWARIATLAVPKASWDAWWSQIAPTLDEIMGD